MAPKRIRKSGGAVAVQHNGGANAVQHNGGANAPDNQQHVYPVVEVLGQMNAIMNHDHLYTVQREFYELTQTNRLQYMNFENLDFLPHLKQGDTLYGTVQHNGQFYFNKYTIQSITESVVNGINYTFVALANIQYTFHQETGAHMVVPFFPIFGKFLVCNMDATEGARAKLYEQIDLFYPRNQEILYYVAEATPPAP